MNIPLVDSRDGVVFFHQSVSRESEVVKVCLLGDMAVGKTSLGIKFAEGTFFPKYRPSFHANHFEKEVKTPDCDYRMLVWDTAGTERFRAMTSHYLRGAKAAIVVFDVTSWDSFENLKNYWIPMAQEWQPGIPCLVVANKIDVGEQAWGMSLKHVVKFCHKEKLRLVQTSAKTGANVERCFYEAAKIVADMQKEYDRPDGFLDSTKLSTLMKDYKDQKKNCPRRVLDRKLEQRKLFDCCTIL